MRLKVFLMSVLDDDTYLNFGLSIDLSFMAQSSSSLANMCASCGAVLRHS